MLEALTQHRFPSSPEAAHDAGAEEEPELSDVCAVVVRWFGGTLLGAGGLVRAYSQAVTETLDSAPTLVRERRRHLSVAVSPAFAGKVDNELRASGIAVLDTDYGASEAVLHTGVPDRDDAVRSTDASSLAFSRAATELRSSAVPALLAAPATAPTLPEACWYASPTPFAACSALAPLAPKRSRSFSARATSLVSI